VAAAVTELDARSPRLLHLQFACDRSALYRLLYAHGRPVQYAYLDRALALWDVQTRYASRPWAAEAPSAGLALSWDLLLDLQRRGVHLATLTHAAGLSSTGDPALDALLPLREAYDIPQATVNAITTAKACGRRVLAVGTTVTRALEGAVRNQGQLTSGEGVTDLRLAPDTQLRIVDGILTGMHDASSSHFALLGAFAPTAVLQRANAEAEALGYREHEFGDAMLVWSARPAATSAYPKR
jgi:S-adenosylmethionine:tRNA ribosyltransferase-isomerase